MTMQKTRCDDIRGRLGSWYDGEIAGAEAIAVHVESCPHCARELNDLRAIDRLLTVDIETSDVGERVLAAVRSDQRPGVAWWLRVAAAAAAALALGVITSRSLPEQPIFDQQEARPEVFASLDQHFGVHANAGFDGLAAEFGGRR